LFRLLILLVASSTCPFVQASSPDPTLNKALSGLYAAELTETILFGTTPNNCYMIPFWKRSSGADPMTLFSLNFAQLTASSQGNAIITSTSGALNAAWGAIATSNRLSMEKLINTSHSTSTLSVKTFNDYMKLLFAFSLSSATSPESIPTTWNLTDPVAPVSLFLECGQFCFPLSYFMIFKNKIMCHFISIFF
jgi:hypothetical protein